MKGYEELAGRIYEEVLGEFGEGVMVGGDDPAEQDREQIPVSPVIDFLLSGGIEEGSWVALTGQEKSGKAQPLDATVYTPDGPKEMGSLRAGDEVLTPHGTVARVTGVFPQGRKEIFRVFFRGGDVVECCGEHLWEVKSNGKKRSEVLPLLDIVKNLYEGGKQMRPRWSVRLPLPVAFRERETSVDPYVMGLLLGNGGLTRNSVKFSSVDEPVLQSLSEGVRGFGCEVRKIKGDNCDYSVSRGRTGRSNPLMDALRRYDVMGRTSLQKHIPREYLYNSTSKRLALLQGLMDTDGTVCRRGQASYCTSSPALAKDFKVLVESLGGFCRVTPKAARFRGKIFPSYVCHIGRSNGLELFRLPRKKSRGGPRKKPEIRKRIEKVEPAGEKEALCISIDSPDGLYLTDNFVVTHNTTLSLSLAANAQARGRPVFYSKIEGRLSYKHLRGVPGLDLSRPHFNVIQSSPTRLLTAQEHLKVVTDVLKTVPGAVVIIDSISALSEEKEMNQGIGTETRGGAAKAFSQFIRINTQVVPANRSIVVGITQRMANTSGFGSPFQEKCPSAWKYQQDYKLRVKSASLWKAGDKVIGQQTRWVCDNSKNGPPGMEMDSFHRFGKGLDRVYELLQMGTAFGLVRKSGNWLYFDHLGGDKAEKANGWEAAYKALCDNPGWADALYEKILAYSS